MDRPHIECELTLCRHQLLGLHVTYPLPERDDLPRRSELILLVHELISESGIFAHVPRHRERLDRQPHGRTTLKPYRQLRLRFRRLAHRRRQLFLWPLDSSFHIKTRSSSLIKWPLFLLCTYLLLSCLLVVYFDFSMLTLLLASLCPKSVSPLYQHVYRWLHTSEYT